MRDLAQGEIFERRFRILRKLGQGGFAVVYLGENVDIRRKVAIKILREDRSHERFVLEGRVLSELRSPHTVQLLDFGRADDGTLYMVFEYAPGETLEEMLEDGPLGVDEALDVLHQALESLSEAHARGIVHRDIKPSNIYVNASGTVRVLDFGVAKVLGDDGAPALTHAGTLVGTPRYIPPELFLGADVTPAADLFALGLCAYELLFGHPANDAVGDEVLRRQIAAGYSFEDIDASPGVIDWLHSLVARQPEDRPANGREALQQLDLVWQRPTSNTVHHDEDVVETVRGPDDRWIGRVLAGRYRIETLLGKDAGSTTYRARSTKMPRDFVVKIVNVYGDVAVKEQLLREVDVLATLRSPHGVPVYDLCEASADEVAIVIDHVEGQSLREFVSAVGPMGAFDAVGVVRQICGAAAEAHALGVVHRNLRPEVVRLQPVGEGFHVRVLGFALATTTAAVESGFASPEQLSGTADARADVYAVGAILHFLLTGHAPVVVADPGAPPGLRAGGRKFPPELVAIVSAALAVDPDARIPTVLELASRLDALDDGILLADSPPSTMTLTLEWSDSTPNEVLTRGLSDLDVRARVGVANAFVLAGSPAGYCYATNEQFVWGEFASEPHTLPLPPDVTVTSLAHSSDLVIAGADDGSVLHVTETGARVLFQDPRKAPITSVAIAANGRVLLAGSGSGRLYVRRTFRSDDWQRRFQHDRAIEALAADDNGARCALASGPSVRVVSLTEAAAEYAVELEHPVSGIAFSHDGYLLGLLTRTGSVRILVADTMQPVLDLEVKDLRAIWFGADGQLEGLLDSVDVLSWVAVTR